MPKITDLAHDATKIVRAFLAMPNPSEVIYFHGADFWVKDHGDYAWICGACREVASDYTSREDAQRGAEEHARTHAGVTAVWREV